NGQRLQGNDDSNGNIDSYLTVKAPEDEELVIRVRDHLGTGGPLSRRVRRRPVAEPSVPRKSRIPPLTPVEYGRHDMFLHH
ncbi:hypothetical protein AB1L30_00835, partial [Bremerella sp. JC817]|uniref:hypothetical protein n=1 Tax=Bremerella sp. JC817 TaxID=3231756 RepID=UPI0034583F33